MAIGGAIFEGSVVKATALDPIRRDPLVEIFVEPKPEESGLPANSSLVAPTLVSLGTGISSVEASRFGHGEWGNRGSVWPGRVTSLGFDEFSYLEVTVIPTSGATYSVAQFVIPQIIVYGTDDGGAWEAVIRSDLDGFAEDLATTTGAGTYRVEFNLSEQVSPRNLVNPVTFRVYLWETAAVPGAAFDPAMWFDIAGNALGTAPSIQVIGESRIGELKPPSISSAQFVDNVFEIEAIDLTPGRTYDLAVTFDLSDPFADPSTDPEAFYRIEEVSP